MLLLQLLLPMWLLPYLDAVARDAKLVVLDWDETEFCVRTSSLHYLEKDPLVREARAVQVLPPKVVADPQGRCAAVLCFDHQLALLPAMEVRVWGFGAAASNAGEGMGVRRHRIVAVLPPRPCYPCFLR